jgi:hypothetical protein
MLAQYQCRRLATPTAAAGGQTEEGQEGLANMREDEALVTVATFPTLFDASVAKGALQAIGIRALVPEETLVLGIHAGTFAPIARLQVFESDAERARVQLRRLQIRLVD